MRAEHHIESFGAKIAEAKSFFFVFVLFYVITAKISGSLSYLPEQAASWLIYIILLILPGYMLAELITGRLHFDQLEKLALALPFGLAASAVPALVALTFHFTVHGLTLSWIVTFAIIVGVYLYFDQQSQAADSPRKDGWEISDIFLACIILAMFLWIYPIFTTYFIDGDLYTFLAGVSDALSGQPINTAEPLFGTDISPGVRALANQFLPVFALWSNLSGLAPDFIAGAGSRGMLAFWTLLAYYFLGKAAGNNSRRVGLAAAAIQLLVYVSAPFFRDDSVSSFYLLRTNADKFTVSVTMLPVVFGLAIHYLRDGRREAFLAACATSFAVSTIHPLISAMLAMGMAAFGGFHFLFNLRSRQAFKRLVCMASVAGIALFLPLVLFVMSRSSAPIAASFPSSFEGWKIDREMTPAFPFVRLPNYNWYTPAPVMTDMEGAEADTPTNPFLIWRYSINMRRERLIVQDLNHYISNPSVVLQPVYAAALLMLPFLFKGISHNLGAQFVVGTSLIILVVMFNPILMPLLGSFVMPWLLWRLVWLLPYSVIFALILDRLSIALAKFSTKSLWAHRVYQSVLTFAPLCFILSVGLLLAPRIDQYIRETRYQASLPGLFPKAEQIIGRLSDEITKSGPAVVAADQNMSVTLSAFISGAHIIAQRVFNTSETFPADQQSAALQRLIDQYYLFHAPYLTERAIEIMKQYNVRYIVVPSGGELDLQMRISPRWFKWLVDDYTSSLYALKELPDGDLSIRGNSALMEHDQVLAEELYAEALEADRQDLLAMAGLAEIYQSNGQMDRSVQMWEQIASDNPSAVVDFRLGQLYLALDQTDKGIALLREAAQLAPTVDRYHQAVGDACLKSGQLDCAIVQFNNSVSSVGDEALRLTRLADLWSQRNRDDLAIKLYEEAADLQPSELLQIKLAGFYQNQKQYDRAEQVLLRQLKRNPLSTRVLFSLANLEAARGNYDQAYAYFKKTIQLQDMRMQESTLSRLTLIQMLLDNNQPERAEDELSIVLKNQPHNASAFILAGKIFRQQDRLSEAAAAYEQALDLDASQVAAFISLSTLIQERNNPDESLAFLTREAAANPTEPKVQLYLGNLMLSLGRSYSALQAYQIAQDLLDRTSLASQSRKDILGWSKSILFSQMAAAFEDQGKISEAMYYYRAAETADPKNTQNQIQLADALRRRNEPGEAEAIYQRVLEATPSDLEAYLQLADLYRSMGDLRSSDQLLKRAMAVYLDDHDQPKASVAKLGAEVLAESSRETEPIFGSGESEELEATQSSYADAPLSLESYLEVLEAEEDPGDVLSLVQIYQESQQIDRGIELLLNQIRLGEAGSLSEIELSGYYNYLGELYVDRGALEDAYNAHQHAVQLNSRSIDAWLGMAGVLLAMGEVEQSRQAVMYAVDISPESVDVQLKLGEIFETLDEYDRAFEIYKALVDNHPGNLEANLALARSYMRNQTADAAKQIFKGMILLYPSESEAYLGLGQIYSSQAQYPQAEGNIAEAIRVDYANSTAHLQYGGLLVRRGRYREAKGEYQRALDVSPGNVDGYLGLGEVERILGNVEGAEAQLKRAVKVETNGATARLALADLYREQNRPDQAEGELEMGLEAAPEDMSVRLALAEHYRLRGQSALAVEQLRAAVEKEPGSMVVLGSYAAQLRRMGREEEAQAVLEQARQAAEPSGAGYLAVAGVYRELEQAGQAAAMLEAAIALEPGDAVGYLELASLQSEQDDPVGALDTLREAVRQAPGEGRAWQMLGAELLEQGEAEQGLAALKHAIEVEPSYLPTYGALIGYYDSAGMADEAAAALEVARRAGPGSYLVDMYAAQMYENALRWDDAEASLRLAVDKAPGEVDPYLVLGSIYFMRAPTKEAIPWFIEALKIEAYNSLASERLKILYLRLSEINRKSDIDTSLQNSNNLLRATYINIALSQQIEQPRFSISMEKNKSKMEEYTGLLVITGCPYWLSVLPYPASMYLPSYDLCLQ